MAARTPSKRTMTDEARAEKNARIKATGKATRERRRHMVCQVRDLKITHRHLSRKQKEQLARLFLEAKWLRNSIVGAGDFTNEYLASLGNEVDVRLPGGVFEKRPFLVLGGQARQSVLAEVNANLKTLSSLKKKGRKVGRLRFVREVSSVNLKQFGSTHKIDADRSRIKVQNIDGWMRVRGLGQLASSTEFANAKLVSRPDGYHLLVTTYTAREDASGREAQTFQPGTAVGIDMGVKTHITLSSGVKLDAIFEETDRLRRLRRKLARQIKGSANYRKTLHQIRRESLRVTRLRDDCANKIVHELLRNETVYLQDENLKSWKTRSGYVRGGKRVHASVLGRVKQMLAQHPRAVVLDRWVPTTATCVCGQKTKHSVEERVFECPSCGYREDRDIHAAKGMIRFGLDQNKADPRVGRTGTLVEFGIRPALMDFGHISTGVRTVKQEAATSSASP